MKQLETGSFITKPNLNAIPDRIRIVTWNINRGQKLDEVIDFLAGAAADLILLQEVDVNARRTRGRNVAREIARALAMNYAFGCEFEELAQRCNAQPAYHGQATISRFPLQESRFLRFNCQSSFWLPRWYIPRTKAFQRRIGGRMALISCIDLPGCKTAVYNVHLESRGDDELRSKQLGDIVDDAFQISADAQVVIAGDFNANLRNEPFAKVIANAGFNNPGIRFEEVPTTAPSRFNCPRTIDWILTKGPLASSEQNVHDSIQASDHYPLSFILFSRPHDLRREGNNG